MVTQKKRKSIILKWSKVNSLNAEGGLGLRQLNDIKMAMQMKLAWLFLSQADELGIFLRYKFTDKKGNIIKSDKNSTIWPGIRQGLKQVKDKTPWVLKDCLKFNFLFDNRLGIVSHTPGQTSVHKCDCGRYFAKG